jgi:hypothetical protein
MKEGIYYISKEHIIIVLVCSIIPNALSKKHFFYQKLFYYCKFIYELVSLY